MSISTQERLARIRVNAFLYFRSDWLARLIEIFGSAEEILKQNADTLAKEAQMNPATAAHFLRDAFSVDPEEELEKTEKSPSSITPSKAFFSSKSSILSLSKFLLLLDSSPFPGR